MTLYLVNHLSGLGLILLVIGGTTALAVIISELIHTTFPSLAESGFEELTGILRTDVFALLYTVVLALVISNLSGDLAEAEQTVSAEASALNGLTNAANSFPDSERESIRSAVGEYLHAVVQDEWPKMRWAEASPRAAAALEGLQATIRNLQPQNPVEEAFYQSSVNDLSSITLNRRKRLQESGENLSTLLRTLLVVGAVVFIALAYPASARSRLKRVMIVASAASFVSFAYLLTMVMDYPFAGDNPVDTAPYKSDSLSLYWAPDVIPRPLTLDTFERLSTKDLIGVWISDSSFGEAVFRTVGDEIRATYRYDKGTVVGTLSPDGVFRGWWCEAGSRKPLKDAGEIEWRLMKTPEGEPEMLDGRWRYGDKEPFRGGWDLTKIPGKAEPPDLAAGFDDPATFCHHP
jgi:hypothetical protein